MFNFFKKEKPRKTVELRDTLFGDMPLSEWPSSDTPPTAEPWISFAKVAASLEKRDKAAAIATLQQITEMPGLESRHYLQAWHFLGAQGIQPPADKAKIVYGVVVEVGMKSGVDIVAAYQDHTARYLNFSGAGIVWEHPDTSLDDEIDALLQAGEVVANKIGPWEQARPAAPQTDHVRLNMLTPSGLHFGYGPFKTLSQDPMGKAIIDPATRLMQALIAKDKRVK